MPCLGSLVYVLVCPSCRAILTSCAFICANEVFFIRQKVLKILLFLVGVAENQQMAVLLVNYIFLLRDSP